MIKIANFLFLITLFSVFSPSLFCAEKIQNISTKIAVIFNTLCAKCHDVKRGV